MIANQSSCIASDFTCAAWSSLFDSVIESWFILTETFGGLPHDIGPSLRYERGLIGPESTVAGCTAFQVFTDNFRMSVDRIHYLNLDIYEDSLLIRNKP